MTGQQAQLFLANLAIIILVPPVTCSVRLLCAGRHESTLVRR
jgi:hypothetical protein